MKIGVKFCGGCNPYIDRKNIIDKVKNLLPPEKYTLEYFNFDDCKIFLVINGCGLSCAKFEQAPKVITVAGFSLDGKQYTENELPYAIVEKILAADPG
ncbi:MAG: hypothetical protein VB084_15815 [Syntrophomonadaceae bacterium]|nr:hypothetical protein [Syntrophomonadaceae bacterium]